MEYSPTIGSTKVFLKNFSRTPRLSFGEVLLGRSAEQIIVLVNEEANVVRFSIELRDKLLEDVQITPSNGCILPNNTLDLRAVWKPSVLGNSRLTVTLFYYICDEDESNDQDFARYSISLILLCTCKMLSQTKAVVAKNSRASDGTKAGKTGLRGTRMSDPGGELDAEKPVEESVFKNFLNYWLSNENLTNEEEWGAKTPQLSLQEIMSLDSNTANIPHSTQTMTRRQFVDEQRLIDIRRLACSMFATLKPVIDKIHDSVSNGKISMKNDKAVHADQGIRQYIVNLFLHFHPTWLRIGLETVYGEVIPLKPNKCIQHLAQFILYRLIQDPTLMKKYAIAHVRNTFRDGYKEAIGKFFLQNAFSLLVFLDHAISNGLINYLRCLFRTTSKHKSVQSLLTELNKEVVDADGSVLKCLSKCGYEFSYVQRWSDERSNIVKNLAVDLQDGALLIRLASKWSGNMALCNQIRGPPISRLQKVHNVKLALNEFGSIGIAVDDIHPNDVVAGHREKTLRLLWRLLCHKIDFPVDTYQSPFLPEIFRLRKLLRRRSVQTELAQSVLSESVECNMAPERISLLWLRTVCAFFDIQLSNLHTSLYDGCILCCAVSFYMPTLLPKSEIEFNTVVRHNECGLTVEELTANMSMNHRIFLDAMHELNVFWIVEFDQFLNMKPLDEKMLLLCLNSLSSALLSGRRENEAALVIQRAWRKHKYPIAIGPQRAAIIMQRCYRRWRDGPLFVKRLMAFVYANKAATVIQRAWRRHLFRKRLVPRKTNCTNYLENQLPAFSVNCTSRHANFVAVKRTICLELVEAAVFCVKPVSESLQCTAVLKDHCRTSISVNLKMPVDDMKQKRLEGLLLIQSFGRRRIALNNFVVETLAAITIQNWWRRCCKRRTVQITDPQECTKLEDVLIQFEDYNLTEKSPLVAEERYPSLLSVGQPLMDINEFALPSSSAFPITANSTKDLLDMFSCSDKKSKKISISQYETFSPLTLHNNTKENNSSATSLENVLSEIRKAENNFDFDPTHGCPLSEKDMYYLKVLDERTATSDQPEISSIQKKFCLQSFYECSSEGENFSTSIQSSKHERKATYFDHGQTPETKNANLSALTSLNSVQANKQANEFVKILLYDRRQNRVRSALLDIEQMSRSSIRQCRYFVANGVVDALYDVMERLNRGYSCLDLMSIIVKCFANISAHVEFVPHIVAHPGWLATLTDFLPSIKDHWHVLFLNIMTILERVAIVYEAQVLLSSDERRLAIWRSMRDQFDRIIMRLQEVDATKNQRHYSVTEGRIDQYRSKLNALESVFAAYSLL